MERSDRAIEDANVSCVFWKSKTHKSGVIMVMMVSQITSDYLLNCLFRHRSKKTSKLQVTGLCEGNSPGAGESPPPPPPPPPKKKKASNAENLMTSSWLMVKIEWLVWISPWQVLSSTITSHGERHQLYRPNCAWLWKHIFLVIGTYEQHTYRLMEIEYLNPLHRISWSIYIEFTTTLTRIFQTTSQI